MKGNIHKKYTFEDKFYRNYCKGKINHNSGWAKEKVKNRRLFRRRIKDDIQKIEADIYK